MAAFESSPVMITTYHHYFENVLTKRLRYVDKINVLLAVLLSVLIKLPYGHFWWNVLATFYRAPLIYLSLWLVKKSRRNHSTVEFSTAKTLAEQIGKSIFSCRFLTVCMSYIASCLTVFTLFIFQLPLKNNFSVIAKEYRRKPAINDEWVFYWFHAFFIAFMYAVQHLVFQRNRLQFKYGVNSAKPETTLFLNIASLFGNAVVFNIACTIISPLAYFAVRSNVYRLNWFIFTLLSVDPSVPRFHISLSTLANLSFVSFFIFSAWEFVNHVYGIYATIGCLDGTKTIGSHSSDPAGTLLSGLRDLDPGHQLTRLTAFQELAHLASSMEPEGIERRNLIFNGHPKGSFIWTAILDECSLVIKDVTSRINYRSKSDMEALKSALAPLRDQDSNGYPQEMLQPEKFIFGNSMAAAVNESSLSNVNKSSPLKKYDDSASRKKDSPLLKFLNNYSLLNIWGSKISESLKHHVAGLVNPNTSVSPILDQKLASIKKAISYYSDQFLASSVGVFFRTTIKRDAESRVIDPVTYGNAVIALAGFLMHAIEEDRKNTVTDNNISEVLSLLERPIRSCSNYTDILPSSVFHPREDESKQHLIALLHDLTMNEFVLLCFKYNFKLNDLLLSSRAFKLAKWVVDASIAQQQKHRQDDVSKYI